jgi:hypothetical protein
MQLLAGTVKNRALLLFVPRRIQTGLPFPILLGVKPGRQERIGRDGC